MKTERAAITVVIPTLNEASHIADCIRQVEWVDEIIVADGGSIDGTIGLARAAGARVLENTGPTIAAQKNAAIAVARNNWILSVDSDERVTPELAREVSAVVGQPAHRAYAVRRRNLYLGRVINYGGWGSDWVVRLFHRDQRFIEQRAHEALQRQQDLGRLSALLEHVPYRDLGHHIEKLDRYARWAARDLADRGRHATWADLLIRPAARFVRMYVLQLGVLDGWRGTLLSGLGAVSALMKYARLWEIQEKKKR
jgi:glycosyltransferase involved in cell wall biosynthesis